MQLHPARTFQPISSPKEAVPYTSAAMRQDLDRLRRIWEDCQASRDRNAIYAYLTAVYGLVAWWAAEGREVDRVRRALRSQRLEVSDREDPFAAIIRSTADPAKADKRTRSKWSRVMRYVAAYKPHSEPLGQFIKRKVHQRLRRSLLSVRWARYEGPETFGETIMGLTATQRDPNINGPSPERRLT
jgi:hypothetical protein